jgi:predicted TIM-barrel fold metal-dependent hydrolase
LLQLKGIYIANKFAGCCNKIIKAKELKMPKERTIVDIHIHLFNQIAGQNNAGPTTSLGLGWVRTGTGPIRIMPPYCKETAFPAEVIIDMMDFVGIGKAVLLQNPLIGTVNDQIAAAIARYPERLIGTIQVDPLDPQALDIIRRYAQNPRQNILKFEMSDGWGWSGVHPGLKLDDACFTPIWELAVKLQLPVILDPGRPNNAGYQVTAFDKVTSDYPQLTFILEHLGGMNRENLHLKDRWTQMVRLGKKPNVYLGIAAIGAGLREDFPCPEALGLLREGVELAGAEKILWGSDIPGTLKQYTYQQMADMVITYADFLSETEKDLIMGGNALRILSGFHKKR